MGRWGHVRPVKRDIWSYKEPVKGLHAAISGPLKSYMRPHRALQRVGSGYIRPIERLYRAL